MKTTKAVRSRHPHKCAANRVIVQQDRGAVLVGVGWGVSGFGIGELQIRHCLGPINVTDLGRGSVSRVPQPYPLASRSLDIEAVLEAWNFCPYRGRAGGGGHHGMAAEGRAPCRQSMPEDFTACSGKRLV